jgi:hypothetical protein
MSKEKPINLLLRLNRYTCKWRSNYREHTKGRDMINIELLISAWWETWFGYILVRRGYKAQGRR